MAVFIHGLSLDMDFWIAPERCTIGAGLLPLTKTLRDGYPIRSIAHDLMDAGWGIAAWSQRRSVGPIEEAIGELKHVLEHLRTVGAGHIALVGHSRGGLIARALVERDVPPDVIAVVAIGSPHAGSTLGRFAKMLRPLWMLIAPFAPMIDAGKAKTALARLEAALTSDGVQEMLPGSEFLRSLKPNRPDGECYYLSIGGTDPVLVQRMRKYEGLVPMSMLAAEMQFGKGDGLVTAKSARLPYANEHMDFPLNHIEIAFEPQARQVVVQWLMSLQTS